jgi:hypothetical protein
MTRRAGIGAVLLVVALGFAVAADAQPPLIGPPLTDRVAPAPLIIIPSLTVTGEYNDNVLVTNRDKRSDEIIGITPALDVLWQGPIYRLLGRASLTSLEYLEDDSLSKTFGRFSLLLDGSVRVTPALTLRLADALYFDRDTKGAVTEGVSTGRDRALSNTVTPGFDLTTGPRTRLRFSAPYTLIRFASDDLHDSDVYHADIAVEHDFTRRFTGILGYNFGYFDIHSSTTETGFHAITNTPRAGFITRLTETLSWHLEAGPSFLTMNGTTRVRPAAITDLTQLFSWGSASLLADATITTAGGLGGPVLDYGVGGSVKVTKVLRGLVVEVAPRYAEAKSIEGSAIDIRTFTFPVYASYQLTSWLAVIGSYTFFHQRSDSTLRTAAGLPFASDADQHRVSLGLQVFYPIRVD